MKKIFFAITAMIPFSFLNPESYGQADAMSSSAPVTQSGVSENGELLNLITLADLTLYKNPSDVSATAKRLLGKTEIITDEKLRTSVRLALAEIVGEPESFPEIRARHFKKISARFSDIADEARKNKNYKTALNAAQIAAKADPKNLRARLILSVLVDGYGGDTATALKLMHAGLKFIDLDAAVTPSYFSTYFEMLAALQQDFIAAEQAQNILKNPSVPKETRSLVALAGAFALYNRGAYAESLDIIEREGLEGSVQARILKARNFFDAGKHDAAISLLDKSIAQFPAEKREPLFNQLSRFFSETGNYNAVLEVAKRQLTENPDVLSPYLRRLFAYKKLGNDSAFETELESIFAQFSMSQSALVALSNFAAEQGLSELALRCLKIAQERHYDAALFIAATVESLVAANRPAEAIDAYVQITSTYPNALEEFQTIISAVLASAYAEAAAQETDPAKAAPLQAHSELLLNQFLSDKSVRPENQIAVIRHFRRIKRDDIANTVATSALKAFPWHSQIRADWLSLQLANADRCARINVSAEVRTLAEMRRPAPTIWKEVLSWLNAAKKSSAPDNGSTPEELAQLRALVIPLSS